MYRFKAVPFVAHGYMVDLLIINGYIVTMDADKKIFESGAIAIKDGHNSRSNAKLASGVAPIPKLLAAGIKVGLGTDGAASNNKLDIFDEIVMAALIHKAVSYDPTVMDAYTVLKMATIDAAKVLSKEEQIGSLEKGKRADIIIIDADRANTTPMYNIYSHLVYAINSSSVETVIIEGKVIMDHYTLLTMNEERVKKQASRFAEQNGVFLARGTTDSVYCY